MEALGNCLKIQKSKFHDFEAFKAFYQAKYGKEYFEDEDPMPFLVFERDPKTKDFKANKQKSVLPKNAINQLPDEFNRFS